MDEPPQDIEHEDMFKHYFSRIDKELHMTEKGHGFIFLYNRAQEPGCTDMITNMQTDKAIFALESILWTLKKQK